MKNVTYINASAGSGKTYTLTHKLAELIAEGEVQPEQVIMTTFTVKAAAEMKEEAKKVLYELGLFDEASRLDQAMMGTIHSVANALIGKYWFFLGLSPDMGVMAEEDTDFYRSQSLSDLPTAEELRRLHAFSREFDRQYEFGKGYGLNYKAWQEDLDKIIGFTTNYGLDDYSASMSRSLYFLHQFVDESVKLDYTPEELTNAVKALADFKEAHSRSKGAENRRRILGLLNDVNHPTIAWYNKFLKEFGKGASCPLGCEAIRENLSQMWHSPLVYERQKEYIELLFTLAARWRDRYAEYKRQKNVLDYNDMERYLHELLQNEEVSAEIARDYRYLFVDEYQDCSPIQVKIFDRLSDLMAHSFWVGDYKQAIYAFRGSDTTLTKAVVDRAGTGTDGCDTMTLDTSYRSLPDIVDVCNKAFTRTFSGVLPEESVCLKHHRENEDHVKSLRLWDLRADGTADLAHHILALLQDKEVKPSDIAVLCRYNDPLKGIANALSTFGIPVSLEETPVVDTDAYQLVMALLSLVASDSDSLAKASVAFLTEVGQDATAIVNEKVAFDAEEDSHTRTFFNDVPLVQELLALRPTLLQQSVASLVETLIVELNLFNVVKRMGRASEGQAALKVIINTATAYEQHCVNMGLPATVTGFQNYLSSVELKGTGDDAGVQLFTYHGAKGLQWKYVILTSLDANPDDAKKCVKREVYGVHFHYTEQPSAGNPYPEVYISLLPYAYGRANVPADIQNQVEQTDLYKAVHRDMLAEWNRLLYVGMTRPQDVLILELSGKTPLQWMKDVGLKQASADNYDDPLGVGIPFHDSTISEEAGDDLAEYTSASSRMAHAEIAYHHAPSDAGPMYVSPSSLHERGDETNHWKISDRIPLGPLADKTMTDVGNCIHQIYSAIEDYTYSDEALTQYVEGVIARYGLKAALTSPGSIISTWQALTTHLTKTYGRSEGAPVLHERPFSLLRDGQHLTGSMDLVWPAEDGNILIDFKTNPMGEKAVLDSSSEHYVGWYAGQLDAYATAMEAAGETVSHRFIFYPVSGLLVELSKPLDLYPQHEEDVIHAFNVKGFDFKTFMPKVAVRLEQDDGSPLIVDFISDDEDHKGWECHKWMHEWASAQGIDLTLSPEGDILHIEIPWLASIGDVDMAVTVCKLLREQFPDCAFYMNNDAERQVDMEAQDTRIALISWRLQNLQNIIDQEENKMHVGVNGFYHTYLVPSHDDFPDLDDNDLLEKAHQGFVYIQWIARGMHSASEMKVVPPDGGESFTARVLSNSEDTFVGVCQKIFMMNAAHKTKIVDVQDFIDALEDNPGFERLDYGQFIIRTMESGDWEKLWAKLDGEVIEEPRTYILRWNPAISSSKLKDLCKAARKWPDGFQGDWSIYEWQHARKGDRYFMERVGDDHAGIVFAGRFLSDPYPGKDWAGTDRQRYYVDISIEGARPDMEPIIPLKDLQQAVPEIEWTHGHSGQEVSFEQAQILMTLWEEATPTSSMN